MVYLCSVIHVETIVSRSEQPLYISIDIKLTSEAIRLENAIKWINKRLYDHLVIKLCLPFQLTGFIFTVGWEVYKSYVFSSLDYTFFYSPK